MRFETKDLTEGFFDIALIQIEGYKLKLAESIAAALSAAYRKGYEDGREEGKTDFTESGVRRADRAACEEHRGREC
jgi:flagellar biosynthesis/type III secretory pathway protein FliH